MFYEINVLNQNSTPITASIIEGDGKPKHMHGQTQIIVLLKGKALLETEEYTKELSEDDIALVNPYTIHSVSSKESCIFLSVMIKTEGFLEDGSKNPVYFELNNLDKKSEKRLESIRYLIFSLIRINSINAINAIYNTKGIAYSLFAQLINDFQIKTENYIEKRNSYDSITKITSYINDNYKDIISLEDLSTYFGYTDTYISKLFKTSLNTTFIKYYDNVRVNHSLEELLKTTNSIEVIASKYGFENSRSYVRACNSVLNENPSEYRKKHRETNVGIIDSQNLKERALDIMLEKYRKHQAKNNISENVRDTTEVIKIKSLDSYKEFKNPANKILLLGGYSYIFNEKLKQSLSSIVKEIPFEYIKITDLFKESDLYQEYNDSYLLNKSLIDNLTSILVSLNLKPYFSFKMGEGEEWKKKLYELFIDYISKVGFDDIIIQIDSQSESYDQMLRYYNKLKSDHKGIIFSSPTITSIEEYKLFSEANTFFNNICDIVDISIRDSLKNDIEKNSSYTLELIKKIKNEYYLNKAMLLVEDISFTKIIRNYLNDTLYLSSFNVKTFFELYNMVDYIAFNPMFDLPINSFYDNYPYLGYRGSFTYTNTKKASYNAIKLISKLKNRVLKVDKNYFVSYEGNRITILLNNYNHFSDLFADGEYYKLTEDERYTCFPKSTNIHFKIEINKLPYKQASIKTIYINEKSGSSYDIYKNIAGLKSLSAEEAEQLKALSEPHFKIEQIAIKEGELRHETMTEPFETKLVEITFK